MNKRENRNKWVVLIIFGMTIVPFVMAWLLGGKATFIDGQINNGRLITPAVTTNRSDLTGIDPFSVSNIGELEGRWVMLNVLPEADCNAGCLEAVYKTKQLHLMMNKDLLRIRRAVVVLKDVKPEVLAQWFSEDNRLLKVKPSVELSRKIIAISDGHIPDGMLLLMDPLGNLMMKYDPGFDPYKVKSDLMHLLRISQIG